MTQQARPTFSAFFSFADFEQFLTHERRTDLSDAQSGAGYRELLGKLMEPALATFIGALADGGQLVPMHGTAGRSGTLMRAWNGLFDTSEDRQRHLTMLAQRLASAFLFIKVYDAVESAKYASDRAAYEDLIDTVDRGNLAWWNSMIEEYCFVSGDRFKLSLEGWRFRLGQVKGRNFVPMEDISIPPVAECEIEFESGELLIADWFRLEAFTKAVQATEDPSIDINSIHGRVRRTEEYADKHQFISVSVGNSSPDVFVQDGALVVGHANEDLDEHTQLAARGSITTDLWWVTIIDRQRLIEILSVELGVDAAAAAVSDYLANHDVLTVQVAPGTHRVYFSGSPEIFSEHFQTPDLEMDDALQPMFVLSPKALQLTAKVGLTPPSP